MKTLEKTKWDALYDPQKKSICHNVRGLKTPDEESSSGLLVDDLDLADEARTALLEGTARRLFTRL